MSMMSTSPDRVISLICSRYSSSVRKRTSPACISGDWPGAPMPSAMSASLASAMMNSRQPGSAWIAASLVSRDFFMALPVSFALPRDGDARMPRSSRCRRLSRWSPAAGDVPNGCGARRLPPGAAPPCAGLAAAFLLLFVDGVDRFAEDLGRVLEGRRLLGPELDLEMIENALCARPRSAPRCRRRAGRKGRSPATTPAGCGPARGPSEWTTSRIEMPTAKPAPPLSEITSAPLPRVRLMIDSASAGVPPRESLERQAAGLGGRPDRHHAVAVLAQDQARDLGGRNVDALRRSSCGTARYRAGFPARSPGLRADRAA